MTIIHFTGEYVMGSTISKKITFENAENGDSNNIIMVSEAVVKRLKGRLDDTGGQEVQAGLQGPPTNYPQPYLHPDASATSLQVRQEKEAELQKVQAYWRKRLQEVEDEHMRLSHISEDELEAAVREVDKLFPKTSSSPLCPEQRQSVLKCYQENPKHSLLCSDEVRAFRTCVESARLRPASNKG